LAENLLVRSLRDNPLAGLVWTLVRTDFKARYHGGPTGFLWALLKPLAMFLILLAVFSFLFLQERNYTLDLIVGLLLWDFFAESTKVGLMSLHSKGYLINKARFPRWIVVVTSASNAVITLFLSCVVVGLFLAIFHGMPSLVGIALFIGYMILYALFVTGLSLGLSVLFLRYRDLNQIWDVVLQAGFFAAPIVYPLRILPERFHAYLYLFPVTSVVQFSRAVLVEGTIPSLTGHLLLLTITALSLIGGTLIFRRGIRAAVEEA
jgi:lipopolysaccharide transport system permease protein